MAKFTQPRVDFLKTFFAADQSLTDKRFEYFIQAIAHGIEGHGHRFTGGEGDTAGDAAGVWNIQSGIYTARPSYPKQGDLYIALDQRALFGCIKNGQWTMIGACYPPTPLAYRAWGGGLPACIKFYVGIPPDTSVFCTTFPDTWSNPGAPRTIRADDLRYVVWSVYHSGQKRRKILFSRSEDAGATFSDPIAVSDLTSEPDYSHVNPDLSLDLYGFLHLTWRGQFAAQKSFLYYSKSLNQGNTWSTPLIISTEVYRPPRIAAHGGGEKIVILMKTVAGNLYVYRSEDAGVSFPYQVWIPAGGNPGSTGADYDLCFAGNLLYGASSDTDRLHLFRSPDYGVTWLVLPRQPSGTIEGSYGAVEIAARDGKLWVIYSYWTDEEWDTSAIDCYFTLDDFENWDWARIYGPTEEWLGECSIELLEPRLHAVYRDELGYTVYRSRSANEGVTWGAHSTIIDLTPTQHPADPIIAELYELA